MIEKPAAGRTKIFKNGNELEIEIPSKKNWFIIAFLGFWLAGWLAGELTVLGTLTFAESPSGAKGFMLIWLTLWTLGGLFVLTILLWMIVGKEIVSIKNGVMEVRQAIGNLGRSKRYDMSEIKHLALNPAHDNDVFGFGFQRNFYGLRGGVLKFDYGLKTIKFVGGIDEAEGRLLLEVMKANPNFKEENF